MNQRTKNNLIKASLFVFGVIITILITKISDSIFPNNPVIIKEISDTIKIVHDYRIPKSSNNDSTQKDLEAKIRNLELLNKYDAEIKQRITTLDIQNKDYPNLIVTPNFSTHLEKGYTYGSSSAYFNSNCPNLDNEFIDIKFNFFEPTILNKIAYVRLNIYKYEKINDNDARASISEDLYEVKINNFIRISNDLSKGKYQLIYGFMFKKDLNQKFPCFYFKKCVVFKK